MEKDLFQISFADQRVLKTKVALNQKQISYISSIFFLILAKVAFPYLYLNSLESGKKERPNSQLRKMSLNYFKAIILEKNITDELFCSLSHTKSTSINLIVSFYITCSLYNI